TSATCPTPPSPWRRRCASSSTCWRAWSDRPQTPLFPPGRSSEAGEGPAAPGFRPVWRRRGRFVIVPGRAARVGGDVNPVTEETDEAQRVAGRSAGGRRGGGTGRLGRGPRGQAG